MVSHKKRPTNEDDEPSVKRHRDVEQVAAVVVQEEEKEPVSEAFQPIPLLESNDLASDMENDGREPVAQHQKEPDEGVRFGNVHQVEDSYEMVPRNVDQVEDSEIEQDRFSDYAESESDSDDEMEPELEEENEVLDLTAPVDNRASFYYDDHRCNVWPPLYEIIRHLKRTENMQEELLVNQFKFKPDFMELYETSIDYLIGMNKPAEPNTEEETQNFKKYWYKREKLILYFAKKFHMHSETRPGCEHHYGYLFPAKFSYNMIEYLITNVPQLGYRVPFRTSIGDVDYPEFHEIRDNIRVMMDGCIMSDRRENARNTMVGMVKKCGKMDEENLDALDSIINEMNFLFSTNFEFYIINKAVLYQKKHRAYAVPFESFNRKIRFRDSRYQAFLKSRNNENLVHLPIQQNQFELPKNIEIVEVMDDGVDETHARFQARHGARLAWN
ncbi:hypothetical protein GCK72_023339 [Caenorhabditis remanei]|uniref:Uncharacterized protein n=1 Tax=Caenorhabditis remanei TaxID=31234 RepID=A0A6A5FWP7_CAERE|nr:hypothetical protein GCK72_023339 [Caenorhabditis remanei]KAF1746881.1 hypothetical protein GCK72_023339 [Caenorhabditis remanei]